MKKCPYCAEENQDAAIVCRFCQRELPAQPPGAAPPSTHAAPQSVGASGRLRWVAIVIGLLLVLGLIAGAVALLTPSKPGAGSASTPGGAARQTPPAEAGRQTPPAEQAAQTPPEEPALQISGEKGRLGFDFTNRERGSLSQCRATITDAQGTNWIAYVTTIVPPYEDVTVWRRDFRHEGQELPWEFGRAFPITLSCVVDDVGVRRRVRLR